MSFDDRTLFQTDSEDLAPTVTRDGELVENQCTELFRRYEEILSEKRHSWTTHLRLLKKLGAGGQGVVFLTERRGSDSFTLPVALKVFSPERYATPSHYDADMARMGRVAAKVARIQHENLLVVICGTCGVAVEDCSYSQPDPALPLAQPLLVVSFGPGPYALAAFRANLVCARTKCAA